MGSRKTRTGCMGRMVDQQRGPESQPRIPKTSLRPWTPAAGARVPVGFSTNERACLQADELDVGAGVGADEAQAHT